MVRNQGCGWTRSLPATRGDARPTGAETAGDERG
jgi:hypothetical protein